jgi:dolichol-phosphate mannosyltransferase
MGTLPLKPEFSVVIPVYCEAENLETLHQRLVAVVDQLQKPAEFIFVDDASVDGSSEILRKLNASDDRVRILKLSRNFGHQAAITAGLDHVRGDWVVVMDGDLQDPPEVIPAMLERQLEGDWDVVYGVRRSRPEHVLFQGANALFYRLLKLTSSTSIPSEAGDFCLMRRRVVDELCRLPERNRFIRGLRAWVGFRQTSLEFDRPERHAGSPRYTLRARVGLAFNAIFGFSYLPLRLSTFLGVTLSISGLAYAFYILVGRMSGRFTVVPGWATVVISVLVLGGVQLVMLGIIGEYLGRIYEELKRRPQYIIERKSGFRDDTPEGKVSAGNVAIDVDEH